MGFRRVRPLFIAAFSLLCILSANTSFAQEHGDDAEVHPEAGPAHPDAGHEGEDSKEKGFNASHVIFGHILDAHEYHITDIGGTPISLPLPVILYSPQRGLDMFMSSKFHHGHEAYRNYRLNDKDEVIPVKSDGVTIDTETRVYDLSITRNVFQMFIAMIVLVWLMLSVAKAYKKGQGVTSAPKGKQNLMETVIVFVRDEVARPNLGHKYRRYLPYLLTVFFFILVPNLFGLIPGTANVTGNIAFTVVLGVISFIVILGSSNRHFWGHIFNPPGVPGFVKPILVLVEFLSIFIKPFALIIRLFANMVAGHIIIICLISLIFIFGNLHPAAGWGASPVAVAFTIFIYFIEVLVAFIQAFIFTNLTAVFIGQAFEGGEHHGEEVVV
ncbi:MAG TPA: F0F1 ATP synthase subunit A [Chitinophagaceae bacterium]